MPRVPQRGSCVWVMAAGRLPELSSCCAAAPAARLERGLQDAWVRDSEDARFSLELSASVQGAWFLNGVRLGEEEGGRYGVQHCRMEHSLLIRGAQLAESGATVTFVAGGVRDSATLHVQGERALTLGSCE